MLQDTDVKVLLMFEELAHRGFKITEEFLHRLFFEVKMGVDMWELSADETYWVSSELADSLSRLKEAGYLKTVDDHLRLTGKTHLLFAYVDRFKRTLDQWERKGE